MRRGFVLFALLLLACGPSSKSSKVTPPSMEEEDPTTPPSTEMPKTEEPPACASDVVRSSPVTVIVTPDDGMKPIFDLVAGATASIDMTIFTLSSKSLVSALGTAVKRGVRVRIILDRGETTASELSELKGLGIDARLSDAKFTYTHQKTVTIDANRTFVFSGNFDTMSFSSGRNYGVVDADPQDVADFGHLFEADWSGQTPDLSCTRLVIAPNNAAARLLDLVGRTTTTLDVEALYATDNKILSAIEAAKKRGAKVRVLFNDPAFGVGDATDEAIRLGSAGIEVRKLPSRFIHAKLLYVDRTWAFVGSENFSTNSLRYNREAGVMVSKADADVERIGSTFDADWASGVPF